ncbi:MAG TPA: SMP-30/gluconolactonase/LRE family protein [Trebonia sp.]|jgi:sugar lactone lactonase YvrE|nr:SMP-30/gluconolactonase/LRE family protein [Trebonia sp.]
MDVHVTGAAETVGEVRAALGEGPYWVPEEDRLLWIDIERGLLHRTDVASGATVSDKVDAVSAAFPALGGGVLTAGGNRLTLRTPTKTDNAWAARDVAQAPARDDVRFNDGGVDPAGRVWIGSMHKGETEPVGELYRLDAGGVLTPIVKGAIISNGLGWSPDGARLYYSDSGMRRVDMFDYDPATGEAFQRRVFVDLRGEQGVPDGLTVDADGCVWVAMWGGGALRRFTPSGQQDAVLPVPVSQPTSCAFGGRDLSELFVTTARVGLSEAVLAAQPLAGRLLRFRPGPVGLPSASAHAVIPS